MNAPLEIIMPVRNPGNAFKYTLASLVAQTDRRFAVLFSDNYSSKGKEYLDEAEKTLTHSGITVRRVKPPREFRRLEHWNWAHAQAVSDWIKPLSEGEMLEPDYVARILDRAGQTKSHFIRCEFPGKISALVKATYLSPSEFLGYFPQLGNWLGTTINLCFRRTAWLGAGGYAIHLPVFADYNLCIRLALEAGVELIHEPLVKCQAIEKPGSRGFANGRTNGCFESWLILRQAKIYCLNNKLTWPKYGIAKGVWKQYWMDCEYPWNEGKAGRNEAGDAA